VWTTYVPAALALYGLAGTEVGGWMRRAHAEEAVRWFAAEVHAVAAVVGGVAAQEAVKLITKQYVPINNTYVFNGVASVGGVYEL